MEGHDSNRAILLSADRLVVGGAGTVIEQGAVLIRGDRIVYVGNVEALRRDLEPTVAWQHFPDCTILPGLVDSHVHLTFSAGRYVADDSYTDSDEWLVVRALANARAALQAGVTTVRDLGGRDRIVLRVRDAIADGLAPGPRVLASGRPISSPDGHYWWLGGGAEGADQVRALTEELVAEGVDVIKVMATGGNFGSKSTDLPERTNDDPLKAQFSAEELKIVVEIAHAANLMVTAHARGVEGIRNAVEAGVDGIEHCRMEVAPGKWGFDEELARRIAAQGIFAAPTFAASHRSFQLRDAGGQVGLRPGAIPISVRQKNARRLRECGVQVVVGTDAGAGLARFDEAVHLELELLVEAGWEPIEAIEAGTLAAAKAIGRDRDLGSLEPGKLADLVIVRGDPTRTISDVREVEEVWLGGNLVAKDGHVTLDARPSPWPWPYDQLRA